MQNKENQSQKNRPRRAEIQPPFDSDYKSKNIQRDKRAHGQGHTDCLGKNIVMRDGIDDKRAEITAKRH